MPPIIELISTRDQWQSYTLHHDLSLGPMMRHYNFKFATLSKVSWDPCYLWQRSFELINRPLIGAAQVTRRKIWLSGISDGDSFMHTVLGGLRLNCGWAKIFRDAR